MFTPTRPRWILAIGACSAVVLAVPASAAPRADGPATVRIDVAPVTASGHASDGFTVKVEKDDVVECAPALTSPVSISPNVEECSPSAAYAVACWKSATPHQVLCLEDPRHKQLIAAKVTGKFAPTAPVSARKLAPFGIVLTDGTYCTIRDGGAWGQLKSHPNYFGSYSCSKHGVVWSKPNASHFGVDESTSTWTVQTGSAAGKGALTSRAIARAYFVATATGWQ
jgi:hypothetical protein